MIGRTLDHYRVESKLGEGGMGVVYRAHDTHLNRLVAIKVLPADVVSNPERKARFVQEAKAASALNHPNIVHIYDIDAASGVDFIVMEFVEGKTLDERIGRKGLRTPEVLQYAVQIADALAAAHAADIVHRDIKPGNIMVTKTGLVKILDFGLAKLSERGGTSDLGSTHTARPRTEEGGIVGTVSYMSPEQAEGKHVDARSDIFSFGSLLYEMITGRRAFQRDSRVSTLSAVLREQPQPIREVAEEAPAQLEWIVSQCLRKDPGRRFQHVDDVKVALEALKEESDSGRLSVRPGAAIKPRGRHGRAWAIGAVVLAGGAALVVAWSLQRTVESPRPVLTRLTSDSGLTADPALSPDGRLLAYASDRSGEGHLDIWVQQVAGGEPVRLTRHPADDHEPAFSPDATKIVFRSDRDGGGVYLMSALGGEARLIAREGRAPRFSPDGKWIAYWAGVFFVGRSNTGSNLGHIYMVAANGGEPSELQSAGASSAFSPIWSPDGKRILFQGAPGPNEFAGAGFVGGPP